MIYFITFLNKALRKGKKDKKRKKELADLLQGFLPQNVQPEGDR
jgi:hypothetical protein